MNYINNIKNNVINAIKIKRMAITRGLDYQIAKIMYHNGKNDIDEKTAIDMKDCLNYYNLPVDLMDSLDLLTLYYQKNGEIISFEDIFIRISKYANRKYINELKDNFIFDEDYGQKIYELMQSGCSINQAIKKFERKIAHEMKKEKMSEFAALVNILYFNNKFWALEFEKGYRAGKIKKDEPVTTAKNYLFTSEEYKHKKINGIMLMSKTEEGLGKLESLVNYAYKKGDKQFLIQLSQQAENYDLLITDFKFDKDKEVSFYESQFKHIYLSHVDTVTIDSGLSSFFHETTHFLDNISSQEWFNFASPSNPVIKELLKKIESKRNIFLRALDITYFTESNARRYVKNRKLRKKWLDEIKHSNAYASYEDIRLFFKQKVMYEREKYKVLIHDLMDIYDGLKKGRLYSWLGVSGHGKEYYSDTNKIFIEFVAQIGSFYNNGGIDVLNYELGPDLTREIVAMYKSFISFDSNEMNEGKHKVA